MLSNYSDWMRVLGRPCELAFAMSRKEPLSSGVARPWRNGLSSYRWPDILPKDTLPKKHFAERQFAERAVCRENAFCRTDNLMNGRFAEKTFCRKDKWPRIEKLSEL